MSGLTKKEKMWSYGTLAAHSLFLLNVVLLPVLKNRRNKSR